eukprot:6018087-Pyramimonas_sp.AAC.1
MDATIIRSAALTWDQGKEDEELKGDEEVTKPFWCDCVVTDDQGHLRACGKRFATTTAFIGHRRDLHNIRPLVASLAAINQCPWCESTFADRRTAIDRATRAAGGHGICH